MQILALIEDHYTDLKRIYPEGIATGQATFQTEAPTWSYWDKGHLEHSRFVSQLENLITGWAALSPVSSRCVYAGLAEVSVYISGAERDKGSGDLLLKKIIESSEANNIWTLQAGIFPENKASIRLHEKKRFQISGQVGKNRQNGKCVERYRITGTQK